jgi:hypothetical protein
MLRSALERQSALVRDTLTSDGTDEERMRRFAEDMRADAQRQLSAEDAASMEAAAAFDQLWLGLARYWRKKVEKTG